MIPLIAAGIAAAASTAGGVMANQTNRANVDAQTQLQREFAQKGIQWKVADAKKAGLHPLFAMGGSTTAYSPMVLGDQVGPALAEAGQHIARGAQAMEGQDIGPSDIEKQRHQVEMALAASKMGVDDAQRQLYLSEAARNRERQLATGSGAGLGLGMKLEGQTPTGTGQGVFELKAPEILSAKKQDRSVAAGTGPALEERWMRNNLPVILPAAAGESPEEIISEMNPLTWAGLLAWNARVYGRGWLRDMIRSRYGGAPPEGTYKPLNQALDDKGRVKLARPEDYRLHTGPNLFGPKGTRHWGFFGKQSDSRERW